MLLLLLGACAFNETGPTADELLQGTWEGDLYYPAVVLTATVAQAPFQLGCEEYRVDEGIRLRIDHTFTVSAAQTRGPKPGQGYRLDGKLNRDGTLAVYVLPPRRQEKPGEAVAVVVPEIALERVLPSDDPEPGDSIRIGPGSPQGGAEPCS